MYTLLLRSLIQKIESPLSRLIRKNLISCCSGNKEFPSVQENKLCCYIAYNSEKHTTTPQEQSKKKPTSNQCPLCYQKHQNLHHNCQTMISPDLTSDCPTLAFLISLVCFFKWNLACERCPRSKKAEKCKFQLCRLYSTERKSSSKAEGQICS